MKSIKASKQLLHKKKIDNTGIEKETEILLNDFDLDANEIFSWFRGATNTITLNTKTDKEISKKVRK